MALDDYISSSEYQAHKAEHWRKRQAAEVEVRHRGLLQWEWRFYFGRYVTSPQSVHWREYEHGVALTGRGARRAATRRLKFLHTSDQPWSR